MNNNLSDNIIEVKNARKVYRMGSERICAVDDVSFTIKKVNSVVCMEHPVLVNRRY